MSFLIRIKRLNDGFVVQSTKRLPKPFLQQFNEKPMAKIVKNTIMYYMIDVPTTSYLLYNLHVVYPKTVQIEPSTLEYMSTRKQFIDDPEISLYDDTHIGIAIPMIKYYIELVHDTLHGYKQTETFYTIPFSRALEVIHLLLNHKRADIPVPPFTLTQSVKDTLLSSPLPINTMGSLYTTDVSSLTSVHHAYKLDESNFHKAGYTELSDLLVNRPLRYIDKTNITNTFTYKKNDPVTFVGTIKEINTIKNQHASFIIELPNGKRVDTIFFRRQWMTRQFKLDMEVLVMGVFYRNGQISGKSMDIVSSAEAVPIVPIYSQSPKNGVSTALLSRSTRELLDRIEPDKQDFTTYLKNDQYMSIMDAFEELHFPTTIDNYKVALDALAFYELTYMQLFIENKKQTTEKAKGISKPRVHGGAYDLAIEGFPWDLTDAQKTALSKIDERLSSKSAEQILLSAEVGSGKTLVAQLTCLQAVDAGYQAVLAAPTEVLAQQLYNTFVTLLEGIPANKRPSIVYFTGKTKGKKAILDSIAYGETSIIVGTHSVLSSQVNYHNLGVVCVDEQQKFGSEQRGALLNSGKDGLIPDLLTQTATPIPRSTAQAFYGDIDIITMEGKPNGRLPVITKWIQDDPTTIVEDKNAPLWQDMLAEAKSGHKTFIVVPMVAEDAKQSVASVQATYKALTKNFPELDVEYVHGQLKQESQDKKMKHFRDKGDVLIASTVIEVGIDVPEATRMIILSADRLGASSLHQIRGRVGRNSLQSMCYLVSNNESKQSHDRLQALVDTMNGFEIAKIDLKTRGEGDLFGIRQAGDSQMKFVSLVDHTSLIEPAQKLAKKIYNSKDRILALDDARHVLSMDEGSEQS